jgi:hypothetical protein
MLCSEDARFMYKRTPEAAKDADPHLRAAFALLQHLWAGDQVGAWAALERPWPQQVQPLARALKGRMRERALHLAKRAYSDLSAARLAALIGVESEAEAVRVAAEAGFEVDAASGHVVVRRAASGEAEGAREALQRLAEHAVSLGAM